MATTSAKAQARRFEKASSTLSSRQKKLLGGKFELITGEVGIIVDSVLKDATRFALTTAQNRAPVRRVFTGGRARFRTMTMAEHMAERDMIDAIVPKKALRRVRNDQGVFKFRVGTMTQVSPNRANQWRTSKPPSWSDARWGMDTSNPLNRSVEMTPTRADNKGAWRVASNGMALPGPNNEMRMTNLAMDYALNAEGRYALRKAKLDIGPDGKVKDVGRGALFITESTHRDRKTGDLVTNLDIRLGGNLRASIHSVELKGNPNKLRYKIVAGGDRAPYAKYMEFGTRNVSARPFLRPALQRAEISLPQQMRSALVRRLGRKAG